MKRIIQLFLVFMIIFTPNHALALSSKQGSDPTGKSQRYVIEQAPWLDPTICAPTNASIGTPGVFKVVSGDKIYVIGDSITVGMKEFGGLSNKMTEKGWIVAEPIDAIGGKPLQWGIDQISTRNDLGDVDVVLVGLGTNNSTTPDEEFARQIDQMVQAVKQKAPNAKIVWTNFYGEGKAGPPALLVEVNFDVEYPRLNKVLEAKSKELGFSIIPWASSNEAKEYVGNNDVHPSGKYPEMANFIVNQLSNGIGGSGSTTNTQNTNTGSTFSGFNPDPRATQIFNEQMKAQIEKLAPYYKKAAENTGFKNWEILPAIHYLEYGLREENPITNTSYVSPFQMNADELRTKGGNPNDPVYAAGRKLSGEDITRQAEDVIKYWIDRFGVDGTKDFTVEDVLKIGIGYKSGSVYPGASPETHAYSWAGFDQGAKKLPMPWGPGWGRLPNGTIVSDQQEGKLVDRPGMITTFAMVKGGIQGGSSTSPGDCAGVDNGDDDLTNTAGSSVVENATRIFNERGGQQGISGFPEYFHAGAWCADFVSYVYELSGKPFPGGKISSVAAMQAYFQNEGIWHPRGDGYTPQPGDVVVYNEGWGPYPQHVNMVMSVENNIITTIGGNEGNSVKRASFSKVDESYITGYGRPK